MSYENAPSTRMLATHCACCNRPLRDAVSVEAGVGPDCRAKYSLAEAQAEPDWRAASVALERAGVGVDLLGDCSDPRGAVNRLVHAFSTRSFGPTRAALATACVALGFVKLGARLTEVVASVRIEAVGDEYLVISPFVEGAGRHWYAAGGRWDRAATAWRVPRSYRGELWSLLRRLYSGLVGVGPQGLFTI